MTLRNLAIVNTILLNFSILAFGLAFSGIILVYIESKALGLQTLLDRVAKELIVGAALLHIALNVLSPLPNLLGPLNASLAAPLFIFYNHDELSV